MIGCGSRGLQDLLEYRELKHNCGFVQGQCEFIVFIVTKITIKNLVYLYPRTLGNFDRFSSTKNLNSKLKMILALILHNKRNPEQYLVRT